MHVVHITTVPMTLNFLRGQVRMMQHRGFVVHAISSPGEALTSFGAAEHVLTQGVDMSRQITPIRDVGALTRLVRVLVSLRPEIVHAHTPKGGVLGMLAAVLVRTPVRVYHMRGLPFMTATGPKRTLLMATERISCGLAHKVFCVSHSLQEIAVRDGICPADKIVVFGGGSGQGVDAASRFNPDRLGKGHRRSVRSRFGIPSDARVVGFVGRIVRDKGTHELAAAWKQLRARYPDAHLVLAGPIEPQDPIDPSVLDMLQSDDRVHMPGLVNDAGELYPAFDLAVLPTYREGFPNVPLEAAAMELPVVATRIPGCVDAVQDGVTGTLVPPRDPVALGDAIARYLDDPELRRRHGVAGRQRVLRDFRQEVIWEAVYQEYLRLLRERGIDPPTPPEMAGGP